VGRAWHVTFTGKNINVDIVFVRKPEGKRQFGKYSCGLNDKVKFTLDLMTWNIFMWL
jgi:hypothetical protein